MTTIAQAKQDLNAHCATCRECVLPVLKCDEGIRLNEAKNALITSAQLGWLRAF